MKISLNMTFYDFLRLSQPERADHVLDSGTFLGSCPDRALYDMGSFYAELLYDMDKKKIIETRGFRSLRNLEPYLDQIKVNLEDKK